MAGAEAFHVARDLLLRHATDYARAIADFRWPVLDRFNWALDHFDHLPADATALWLVGEQEERLTFGALRARSNQVANHLRMLGIARGDRVLLVLPNIRQLWEAMLGLMNRMPGRERVMAKVIAPIHAAATAIALKEY